MSIYHPLSFAVRSETLPKAVGATFAADGQALIGDVVQGAFGVSPSTGAGTDKFVGFLRGQTSAVPFLQTTAVMVEEVTLNSSGVVTLQKTPLAGTVSAYNLTDNVAVASGEQTISGNTFTGAAAHYSDRVRIVYNYTLTVAMARAKFGDVQPGGYFGDTVNMVSVFKIGKIYTDQFVTSVQWEDATSVKLAAGGKVTDQTGTGVTIPAQIVAIPTANLPYLGLSVSAI